MMVVTGSLTDASFRKPLRISPSVTDPRSRPFPSTTNSTLETTPISSRIARACLTTEVCGNILVCQLCMSEIVKLFLSAVKLSKFFDLFQDVNCCIAFAIRMGNLLAAFGKRTGERFSQRPLNIFSVWRRIDNGRRLQPTILPAANVHSGQTKSRRFNDTTGGIADHGFSIL